MKKKIVSISLVAALLAIALIGGTLAYFTDKAEANNTITMGSVKITLDEAKAVLQDDNTKDDYGEYLVPDAEDRVKANTYNNVYPGQQLPKDPTVTNTGSMDAYVRVKVAFPFKSGADLSEYFADVQSILAINAEAFDIADLSTYKLADLFEGYDSTKWTVAQTQLNSSNVVELTFTCNTKLAPEEKAVLFTAVNVNPEIEKSIDVKMDIKAEAVQAQGFADAAAAFAATFDK